MGFWKNTDTKTVVTPTPDGLYMAQIKNHKGKHLALGSGTTKQEAAADARRRLK